MAKSIMLVGPNIKVYINNKQYKVAQAVTLDVDYGETEIYGIDCPWPQEIAGGRSSVKGSIKGLRIKYSGGLQSDNIRPSFQDLAASPYISIRIQDLSTGEDIALITEAKVVREQHSVAIKGTYKLNFDFIGKIILFALDRE